MFLYSNHVQFHVQFHLYVLRSHMAHGNVRHNKHKHKHNKTPRRPDDTIIYHVFAAKQPCSYVSI